ncbi:MAG: hypothetical protein ABJA67_10220, partial [Chthonomonadales bacterium]
VENTRLVWRVLDSAPVVEPPADFRALVWRKIDANQASKAFEQRSQKAGFDWRSLFRMPTVAWAGAALVVIALLPVVIPGQQTGARMWPWSMFSSSAGVKSATAPLTFGNAIIGQNEGKPSVDVDISNPGNSPVTVDAVVTGNVKETNVKIELPASSHNVYHLTSLAPIGGTTVTATFSWDESGHAKSQELSFK